MKEIKAIIQPFLLARVVAALQEMPALPGLTVSEVRGFGRSRAQGVAESVTEDAIDYVKKVKVEIVVPDELGDSVVQMIQTNAHTGNPGDGKIFVSSVDEVVRISTGERGERGL